MMKIAKNQKLIAYIESLIDINNLNMSISDMMSEIIGNTSITNKNEVSLLTKKFKSDDKKILLDKIGDYLQLDLSNEDDEEIFTTLIANNITKVDPKEYLSNPYYLNSKIDNVIDKEYELTLDTYKAYEVFPLKDMKVDSNFVELNSFGYFDTDFSFIALNKNRVTWMSITPNEIETMKSSLEKLRGTVIVCGLGLGYYPYIASNKEEVKKIIIVEKDKKVIELFKKHLFPQFNHQEKIEIICDDALNYLKEATSFDYAFIDLWHDPYDGIELYIKCKRLEKEGKKYLYWLESSFYILLRRCFISLLEEQLANTNDNNYKIEKSVTDKIINKFYLKTKNLVINDEQQLQDLLSDKSLLNLLK